MNEENGSELYIDVSLYLDSNYYTVILKLQDEELYWLPSLSYYEIQDLEQQLIDTANKIRDYRLLHPIKTKDV